MTEDGLMLDVPALRLKVIGVGGAGNNAVDRLQMDEDRLDVPLANVNTDLKTLASSPVQEKLMIGRETTGGLSAGYDPELGKAAAEESRAALEQLLEGLDLVFLVAGLGGGTGSGAAPVIARMAAEQGSLVVAMVTLPFSREGARCGKRTEEALKQLRDTCDAVIPLPNDLLLQEIDDSATLLDAFQLADNWIGRGIRAIWSMLFQDGLINVDFATLREAFALRGGKTVFGVASGSGSDPVATALTNLDLCPLLHLPENRYVRQTDSLIVHVRGGPDLTMVKVNEILDFITERFGSKEQTVLGAVIDGSMAGAVEITVIGTASLDRSRSTYRRPVPTRRLRPAKPAEAATARPLSGPENTPSPLFTPVTRDGSQFHEPASPTIQAALDSFEERSPREGLPPAREELTQARNGQSEFDFPGADKYRGQFEKTDANLYEGADLDVPTYFRRGLKIVLH